MTMARHAQPGRPIRCLQTRQEPISLRRPRQGGPGKAHRDRQGPSGCRQYGEHADRVGPDAAVPPVERPSRVASAETSRRKTAFQRLPAPSAPPTDCARTGRKKPSALRDRTRLRFFHKKVDNAIQANKTQGAKLGNVLGLDEPHGANQREVCCGICDDDGGHSGLSDMR